MATSDNQKYSNLDNIPYMYIVFHTLNKPNNNTRTFANSTMIYLLWKKINYGVQF